MKRILGLLALLSSFGAYAGQVISSVTYSEELTQPINTGRAFLHGMFGVAGLHNFDLSNPELTGAQLFDIRIDFTAHYRMSGAIASDRHFQTEPHNAGVGTAVETDVWTKDPRVYSVPFYVTPAYSAAQAGGVSQVFEVPAIGFGLDTPVDISTSIELGVTAPDFSSFISSSATASDPLYVACGSTGIFSQGFTFPGVSFLGCTADVTYTYIPEPSGGMLASVALASLIVVARRKRGLGLFTH